jgi:hypothetical protein
MFNERLARLEQRISGLHELMDAKFTTLRTVVDGQAESTKLALDASKEAINKAEVATQKAIEKTATDVEHRFSSVNEFRGALADSQANNVTRSEFDQFRAHYAEQHTLLRDRYAEEIADLKGRLDKAEGRQGGIQNVWGVIVAVVGIAIAVGALVFRNM